MKYIALIGRILYSIIFLMAIMNHFSKEAVAFVATNGAYIPPVFVPLSGVIAIAGALSIMIGYKARWGAWLIIIFLVPVTFIMHAFWRETDPIQVQMQTANFMKNLSLLGAAFMITYFGAGPLSMDARNKKTINTKNKTMNNQRRNKPRSLNFEEYAAEGNRIINEVAHELETDRDHAARVTRAVLHAIRDRLRADDAVEFAQGLPIALKGIYFDKYDISKTPIVIRNREQFMDFIRSKSGRTAAVDFPTRESIFRALQAVFYILEHNMDHGQVEQIKKLLNVELADLIENYQD